MPATPESIFRAWFDGLWNRADASTIDRLLHPDGVIHGLSADGQPIHGPRNFLPFYQAFRGAFPDIKVEVQQLLAQGDMAVGWCRVTGAHRGSGLEIPATGKSVEFYGFAMCRAVDGQVVECWNCFDFLGMYRQLGAELSPPPVHRTA